MEDRAFFKIVRSYQGEASGLEGVSISSQW
jgi:hypothetical protein